MAFIVEDGTGVPDANSYASVEEADAYFADRGNTTWAAAQPAAKQAALINATDYIEMRYSSRFLGRAEFRDLQSLSFPRYYGSYYGTWPSMPANLKRATIEYALRALAGPLAPDPVLDASGLQVTAIREKVGPIEEEKTLKVGGALSGKFRSYPGVDALLINLLASGGGGLVRN